jgi:hypothetical protein
MSGPVGAWLPGVVYKAVSTGKPNVSLPLKADGFNRTVSINGFCTPTGAKDLVSAAFTASLLGGEFQANIKAEVANMTTTTMSFSGVNCKLKTVAIYKTPQAAFEAEMRFQFEECQASGIPSPVSMALVAGVRRDAVAVSNVLTWTKEVFRGTGIGVAPTPPPPPAKIGIMSNTVSQFVGNGTCKAVARKEIEGVPTKESCKMMCLGSMTKATLTNGAEGGCSGFAFSAAAAKKKEKSCILYDGNSSIAESNPKENTKFVCFNMSMGAVEEEKSTALLTTTQAPQLSSLDFTQREIFGARPLAYTHQMMPPSDQPGCFNPVWWFRLTDQMGSPMSVPMSDADLNELLELLPSEFSNVTSMSAPTVLDRVVVDACNFDNHWGRPTCFVPPPKTSPTCHNDAIANAVVTGVATAIGTWLFVGTAFFLVHGATRRKKDTYEQLVDDRTPKSTCPPVIMLITSVVAVGAACLCSFGAFQLVNEILRSQTCYDSDEVFVVFLPACLSTAIAVVIVLQYTARAHPMHSHPMFTQPAKPVDKPQTQLVLVEVPNGAKAGTPVNVNPGNTTMAGSPMASFQMGGSN